MDLQGGPSLVPIPKKCFVCGTTKIGNPHLTFHCYLTLSEEIQNQFALNGLNAQQDPRTVFVCSAHLPHKEDDDLVECFVCGARKNDFFDRQFFLLSPKAKILRINGVEVSGDSKISNYICSKHFKSNNVELTENGFRMLKKALETKAAQRKTYKCCIPSCPITSNDIASNNDRTFYLFPTRKGGEQSWKNALSVCGISKYNKTNVICKRHFEKRFIKDNNCLTTNAIPTLYLLHKDYMYDIPTSEVYEICEILDPKENVIELDDFEENMPPPNKKSKENDVEDVIEIDDDDDDEITENGNSKEIETECPLDLNSVEKVLEHLQPLYDLALLNDNSKAVGCLNELENIFKNEINY